VGGTMRGRDNNEGGSMEGGKDGGEIGGPVCVDVIDWRDQFNAPLSTLSARFSPLRIFIFDWEQNRTYTNSFPAGWE